MRVALDARYVREKPSGIGVYVQSLVDRLPEVAPSDHFLFWANRLAPRPLSTAGNTSEVTVRPGPTSPWTVFWPRRYAPFKDVAVFHSPHNLLPVGLPCASVVTVHDVMSLEHPELHLQGIERLVKSAYYRQAVLRALWQATRLIAPSKAAANRICAIAPGAARRMEVIWEAPDACFQPPADISSATTRAATLIGGDYPYLLVIGANVPTKRHELALRAFAAAGVPRPWRLVFLHRQGSQDRLRRVAHLLGIQERVVWLRRVAREDVVTLLQAAGALLQPSLYEGFGLPVLEAMACGTPVVCSDIPPFREITDGAAWLVFPHNVENFATALQEVVRSSQLRQELRERGLTRSRDFSWDRSTRETMDLYRHAYAAHARGHA